MAYNDSGILDQNDTYDLGVYHFDLQVVSSEGEKIIQGHMTRGDETAAHGVSVTESTQVKGWYVEANESVVSIYAIVKYAGMDTGPVSVPIAASGSASAVSSNLNWSYSGGVITQAYSTMFNPYHISASANSGESFEGHYINSQGQTGSVTIPMNSTFTHKGKTVYYQYHVGGTWEKIPTLTPNCGGSRPISLSAQNIAAICWIMVYGETAESEDLLVARFEIGLKDAGGGPLGWEDPTTGEGGTWTEPGDVGYDDEPDETKTLYLTVRGALSGRHNDPVEAPGEYSYLPMDKSTVPDYGCGGDGGSGGGGGAGASTVIVRRFATGRADSKDITALAKRHGYGSGGGKGGTGGDGIILVYY